MQQAAGVLLDVDAADADALLPRAGLDVDVTVDVQRQVVLRDLVALGQVGVHVVLAVEFRGLGHLAVEREPDGDAELDGATVGDGERAGKPEANGTHQ